MIITYAKEIFLSDTKAHKSMHVLKDSAILHENGYILAIDNFSTLRKIYPQAYIDDRADSILCAGLINAHAHLELSHMRGKTAKGQGFPAWLTSLLCKEREEYHGQIIQDTCHQAYQTGTRHIADIASFQAGRTSTQAIEENISLTIFEEYIGSFPFDVKKLSEKIQIEKDRIEKILTEKIQLQKQHNSECQANAFQSKQCQNNAFLSSQLLANTSQSNECQNKQPLNTHLQNENIYNIKLLDEEICANTFYSLAGHALNTTSAENLLALKTYTNQNNLPFSIHLAEHEDELAMLFSEESDYAQKISQALFQAKYKAPKMRPVPYAKKLQLLDDKTLAVHCVELDDADIAILKESACTVCLCPRSNMYITGKKAPVHKLIAAEIPLCLGTDSLASNDDYNLWNELAFLKREVFTSLSLEQGIQMLTSNPAKILNLPLRGKLAKGFYADFVSIPKNIAELFS